MKTENVWKNKEIVEEKSIRGEPLGVGGKSEGFGGFY
jgi:hypothetical protein